MDRIRRRRDGRSTASSLAVAAALSLALLAATAACGDTAPSANTSRDPGRSPSQGVTPAGIEERAHDEAFELVLRLPRLDWAEGEPIEVEAQLTYTGPQPTVVVSGSGSGLVLFGLEQVGGPIRIGGAATSDCVPRTLERGIPLVVPYQKSGAFSNDDPKAAWYRAFFADPLLRLPAGRWRLTASADFFTGPPCGGDRHTLEVGVELVVS
ncbi:MAG TPA: hypothetical protein VNO86_05220 [Candidatus Binatia bacterium]|nr:hypothetical protein [Candidatus Binatia bacterium]